MRALPAVCHNIDFVGALRGVTHCPVNTSMSFCIHSFVFLEFPYHQAKKASAKSAFYLAVVGFNGIGFTSNKIYKLTDSVCQSIMTALAEMGLNI